MCPEKLDRLKTAALLSRCLVSLCLCGGGFAPRHLNRSAAILANRNCVRKKLR